MLGKYWSARTITCSVLLAISILTVTANSSPVNAHSDTPVIEAAPLQEAPARINISDVILNVRASASVRTKETVRIVDNPSGFNYDGIFIFGIPVIKITEKIGFGDDTEGLDVGYSTYIGTLDNIWFGIEDEVQILTNSSEEVDHANRIFNLAGGFPFDVAPPGNFAKLSKADQTVDDVDCDEYAWKKGPDEFSMCIVRDTALPVVLKAKLDTLLVEVHFSDYNNPENVFRLPRERAKAFFATDAFMSLLGLKNFEYKIVYGTKNAKGVQIDSTIQGLFVQENGAWQASEWAKTDDTSTAATNRYLQIWRSRWTAPGDETKPYKAAPILNPRSPLRFTDKFTRATPFLLWMSMVSDKRFKDAAKLVDNKAEFDGKEAIKYKIGENEKKPDDFIEITVLKEGGVPVHVDYHFTDGGRKNVITWDLISMDKSGQNIEAPAAK